MQESKRALQVRMVPNFSKEGWHCRSSQVTDRKFDFTVWGASVPGGGFSTIDPEGPRATAAFDALFGGGFRQSRSLEKPRTCFDILSCICNSFRQIHYPKVGNCQRHSSVKIRHHLSVNHAGFGKANFRRHYTLVQEVTSKVLVHDLVKRQLI